MSALIEMPATATARIAADALLVTAGSHLARRLGRALRQLGFAYFVTESAHPIVPEAVADAWSYGAYSARYGDVDTPRQLLQLLRRAWGRYVPTVDVWRHDGGYVDPFRPMIQPKGFVTLAEYEADRSQHFAAVRRAFERADVFIYELSQAACWASRTDGAVYPVRPGLVGGEYDEEQHEYVSFGVSDVLADLTSCITELRGHNPKVSVILAAAPTLQRTGLPYDGTPRSPEAAAVLCAAARECARLPGVTYFPAYELVAGGDHGLDDVIRVFLQETTHAARPRRVSDRPRDTTLDEMQAVVDALCDDENIDGQIFKCVVWDLDDTVWSGTLLEDSEVRLRPQIRSVLETLDRRGILHSIASRSDRRTATTQLNEFALLEYFVEPQIGWSSKSSSIRRIAASLNIGLDTIAFIDDQAFERDEVAHQLPQVTCLSAESLDDLMRLPRMNPAIVTSDARRRRERYVAEGKRRKAEKEFVGTSREFLRGLCMVFSIWHARDDDLERAEELVARTHQLNSTGRRYSLQELALLRTSARHMVLMAALSDKYGSHGTIGLCVVHCSVSAWTLDLLAMSCRVMSRDVAGLLVTHLMNLAYSAGVRLQAEFVSNGRNDALYATLAAAGFQEASSSGSRRRLDVTLDGEISFPAHVRVDVLTRVSVA